MNLGLATICIRMITPWCFPVVLLSPYKYPPIIFSRQSEYRAPIALDNALKIILPVCRSWTGMERRWKSYAVDSWQMQMQTLQYAVTIYVAIPSVTENTQHFHKSSTMHCRFIAQTKREYQLKITSENNSMLQILNSYFVSAITCET